MGRHSIFAEPVKAIKTVCINGIYIIDKRITYNRRQKMHKYQKKYDRRLSNTTINVNRGDQFIDIIV